MGQYKGTCSEMLSQFATEVQFESIPKSVVNHVKMLTLDALGLALASSRQEYALPLVALYRGIGGVEESTIVGFGDKVPAHNAALINGVFVHALDWDDAHLPAVVHGEPIAIPPALALAEAKGASGKDFLTAVSIAFEVAIRVALAVPDDYLNKKGFHITGTCGVFGATLAASKLLHLDLEQMVSAMGIAGSQSSGILQSLLDGTEGKRIQPGWAAHNGIIAALFARQGITGPREVLEGKKGFYLTHVGTERYDLQPLADGLGSRWEIERVALKPYPCGIIMQGTIDSAVALRRKYSIVPEDIVKIECGMSPYARSIVFVQPSPSTSYGARFSVPYAVAVALLRGELIPRDYALDRIGDPEVLDLARKVSWVENPEFDFPLHTPGHVVITTRNGGVYEHKEPINRGHPEHPMSREDVERKFRMNAEVALSDDRLDELLRLIYDLESVTDIRQLATKLY